MVLSPEHASSWTGCLAAGDWNLVVHPDDRSPHGSVMAVKTRSVKLLKQVMDLCHLQDVAGCKAYPQGFTFSSNTGRASWSSRLDCIYYPLGTWFADKPVSIPTLWSDHKLVWVMCGILSPWVQIAKAAPCLPDIDSLTCSKMFWGPVLQKYKKLTSKKPTLESWTEFKKDTLVFGSHVQKVKVAERSAKWKEALQGDAIPLEDLPAAVKATQRYVKVLPPCGNSCRWKSALGGNPQDAQPHNKRIPKISRRWESALSRPDLVADIPPSSSAPAHQLPYHAIQQPLDHQPWIAGLAPAPWALAADMLALRIGNCRKAAIRKH